MAVRLFRLLLSLVLSLVAVSAVMAQVGSDGVPLGERNIGPAGAQAIDLRTQLEKGLLARREVEFKFISRVVSAVQAGRLPRSVVDSTFLYARRQPFHRVQYFQRAIEFRAKKLGITI